MEKETTQWKNGKKTFLQRRHRGGQKGHVKMLSIANYLVHFRCSVVSDSLWPHGLQHAKASLSVTKSWSLLRLVSIKSVMPSNHLILCCFLLLLPSTFPSIRVFFQWVTSMHQVVKVLEFQHQSFHLIFRTDFL